MRSVHLGADAVIADFRVHGVGEIDRRRAVRQSDHVAARREAEHLVVEHLQLGVFQKVLGRRGVFQNVEQFAQPAIARAVLAAVVLLVGPVRGDAVFGHGVHVARADLDFDALAFGADHARVQRLVAVRLRRRDVVLEASGHHRVGGVDHAERAVAVFDAVDLDAERHDVGQLFEADVLFLHLQPDRIRRFFAPGDLGLQAAVGQGLAQRLGDARHDIAILFAQERQAGLNGVAGLGVQFLERQVFEFVLDGVHADAFGQRRINLHRLERHAAALFRLRHMMQGAHVVQPVRQLHQKHADVFRHRQHQLAEVLGLLGLVGLEFDARQLGHAVDQAADFVAEGGDDVVEAGAIVSSMVSCSSAVTIVAVSSL
jgi:hypothetical protein